jgi:hypothetical protein
MHIAGFWHYGARAQPGEECMSAAAKQGRLASLLSFCGRPLSNRVISADHQLIAAYKKMFRTE